MATYLILTVEVEVEIVDNDELAAAALVKEGERNRRGHTEESYAQLESDLHAIPGLGVGFLQSDASTLVAGIPGIRFSGSRYGSRSVAEGERLFPKRPGTLTD